nr:MAG TPA: hypothetical protein [Caudoviricetes sp.]
MLSKIQTPCPACQLDRVDKINKYTSVSICKMSIVFILPEVYNKDS